MIKLPEHVRRAIVKSQVEVLRIDRTGGGHLKLTTHGGSVFTAATPSCWRVELNLVRDLRRYAKRIPIATTASHNLKGINDE